MANGNLNVTTVNGLVGLQDQLNTVRTEISATNIGLQNVASLIQTDSFLDQQRLSQEREQERLLAEREVRVGQEQELQRKVTAAVSQPIVRLENKVTSTFGKIQGALTFLFSSFIGPTVLSGFKGAAKLSLKSLNGIGRLLRNSFNAIGSGLSSLRGGFGSVIRSITGVTSRISKAIISLATSPFKAIADVFKRFVPGVTPSGGGAASGGGGGIGFLGLLTSGLGAVTTAQNIAEKDVPGTILGAASIFPSPIQFPAALASFGYEMLGGKNIDTSKFLPQGMQMPSFPKFDFGNMGQNVSNFFGIDLNAPASQIQGNVEQGSTTSSQKPASPTPGTIKLDAAPFTPPPTKSQPPNLSALPEPKPDVIYASSGQQAQSSVVSGQTQTLTDVPLISSSNPDNFYTLYSQVSYNVVI